MLQIIPHIHGHRKGTCCCEKTKLNFHFHDPNPPGVAADAILHLLVEANMGKLEKAIREAGEAG